MKTYEQEQKEYFEKNLEELKKEIKKQKTLRLQKEAGEKARIEQIEEKNEEISKITDEKKIFALDITYWNLKDEKIYLETIYHKFVIFVNELERFFLMISNLKLLDDNFSFNELEFMQGRQRTFKNSFKFFKITIDKIREMNKKSYTRLEKNNLEDQLINIKKEWKLFFLPDDYSINVLLEKFSLLYNFLHSLDKSLYLYFLTDWLKDNKLINEYLKTYKISLDDIFSQNDFISKIKSLRKNLESQIEFSKKNIIRSDLLERRLVINNESVLISDIKYKIFVLIKENSSFSDNDDSRNLLCIKIDNFLKKIEGDLIFFKNKFNDKKNIINNIGYYSKNYIETLRKIEVTISKLKKGWFSKIKRKREAIKIVFEYLEKELKINIKFLFKNNNELNFLIDEVNETFKIFGISLPLQDNNYISFKNSFLCIANYRNEKELMSIFESNLNNFDEKKFYSKWKYSENIEFLYFLYKTFFSFDNFVFQSYYRGILLKRLLEKEDPKALNYKNISKNVSYYQNFNEIRNLFEEKLKEFSTIQKELLIFLKYFCKELDYNNSISVINHSKIAEKTIENLGKVIGIKIKKDSPKIENDSQSDNNINNNLEAQLLNQNILFDEEILSNFIINLNNFVTLITFVATISFLSKAFFLITILKKNVFAKREKKKRFNLKNKKSRKKFLN